MPQCHRLRHVYHSMDEFTDTIMSYISFCQKKCTKTITYFSNNKSWFNAELRQLYRKKEESFRTGDKRNSRRQNKKARKQKFKKVIKVDKQQYCKVFRPSKTTERRLPFLSLSLIPPGRSFFVDFYSAYNTIVSEVLQENLITVHIPGSSCTWVINFPSDKKQFLRRGQNISEHWVFSIFQHWHTTSLCPFTPLILALHTWLCFQWCICVIGLITVESSCYLYIQCNINYNWAKVQYLYIKFCQRCVWPKKKIIIHAR